MIQKIKAIIHFSTRKSIISHFTVVELLGLSISLITFLINKSYVSYPDEFVNLLGGLAINRGILPYVGFFDHHLPLAWYLASPLLFISGNSFIIFRFFWALIVFGGFLCLAIWIKKHAHEIFPYYLIFMVLYPLLAVYFWFHLYLADSLAIFFFSLVFWILLVQTVAGHINRRIIFIASLLTCALIFSSLTYLYLAGVLYLWEAYLLRKRLRDVGWLILVSLTPYILYLIFLLITGSFKDFYIANFVYNTTLYIDIPNYTKGHFFNPLKFGLTLMFNFYQSYLPLLSKIKYIDLYFPISTLAGLGTLSLVIYFLVADIPMGILLFLALSFSAPRSNVQMANETDYQGSLFLVFGLIASLMVLYLLRRLKNINILIDDLKRITQILLALFLLFSAIFLANNTYSKFFMRYTQKMPSINNLAFTASFMDAMLTKNNYYWVGPYEPQEEFFVKNAHLPGKFISLLPQFREDEFFRNAFIQQFIDHPPTLIIFRHDASIFQTPALEFGKFFTDWMADKYTSVEHIPNIETLGSPSSFNLRTDLYVRNQDIPIMLIRLRENGFIR